MKTVFVLCDALKSLYLTSGNMPFLYSLAKKGYYIKQIIPCSGFCERSEIFSGLDGYDTGNFTATGYLPERSPYRSDKFILSLFSVLEKINKRVARRLFSMWRIRKQKRLNCYRVPFRSLSSFALTEDGDKQLIPYRDMFQMLDKAGMTYTLDGFTSLSDLKLRSRLSVVELAAREIGKETDFIPLYIGITDSVGHRYGGDIESIRPTLQKVDSQLKEIYEQAHNSGYSFCVIGDHGMVSVEKKLDVKYIIDKAPCKLHTDYEVFYDSTMARFWFSNERARMMVYKLLSVNLSDFGFIIDKDNCEKYRIPLDIKNESGNPVYGDLVWCANPGVLISPDYFHDRKSSENGMHGYIEVVEGHGTGLFVEMYEGIAHQEVEEAYSSQICGELCKSLGINEPNGKEWKRIVNCQ